MDITSNVILEVTKNERKYRFEMPVGAPFGECYDAAFEVLNKVSELAKQASDKMKPNSTETSTEVPAELN